MISQPLDLNIPSECPACGLSGGIARRSGKDRYGNDSYTLHCLACGLGWMRDRPTPDWYANFYESGDYRKLVSEYHKRAVMATIQDEQAKYAQRLAVKVRPKANTYLLDIGGSTGVIAKAFANVFNVQATVLDPAKEFNAEGVKHIFSSAEDYDTERNKWSTILMCQTIDHLLDPIAVLRKCRKWLVDGGQFFVDILDVEAEAEQKGWRGTLKVDHPWAWTRKAMRHVLANEGFAVVDEWKTAPNHIGFLCE